MTLTPEIFKTVFSRLASGVTVVTFHREGQKHGFTATSLTPVSMEPPIALFCVGRANESHGHLAVGTPVGISILSAAQTEVSNRFASKAGPDGYHDMETIENTPGIPLLPGAVAMIEGAITNLIPAGDHTIYLCQLNWAQSDPDGVPLLYYGRHYHGLGPLPRAEDVELALRRKA
jgi:flavin reductase ActVB